MVTIYGGTDFMGAEAKNQRSTANEYGTIVWTPATGKRVALKGFIIANNGNQTVSGTILSGAGAAILGPYEVNPNDQMVVMNSAGVWMGYSGITVGMAVTHNGTSKDATITLIGSEE